ncbi:uncharacterized protein LOC134851356 isoform X2 [Symsagittifera roscoffensis]|uniref:uncharacterized protein LOC134851356 isoform X2 n=1 Tax=Symsagittifera roscoffensis TaxID=84072 RepID=UPI00307B6F79
MEDCYTPVPLPKLTILKDSELCDKQSSQKKQKLTGTKSCPRVPSKGTTFVKSRLMLFTNKSLTPQRRLMGGTGSVNSPYESSPRKLLVQGEICGKESAPLISPIKNGKCSDEAQNRSVQRNRTVSFCKRRASNSTCSLDSTRSSCDLENSFEQQQQVDHSLSNRKDLLSSSLIQSPSPCRTNETTYVNSRFEVLSKLGSGSFGEVFKVRDRSSQRLFALKKSRERFRGKLDRQRKLQEVLKLEQTGEHTHCVKFVHAWEESNFLFIQTELCSTTLLALTAEGESGCITEGESWLVLIDMLHALTHLATHKLIHLDIKPDNIFVTFSEETRGEVVPPVYKLGDFGLMINYEKDAMSDAQEGDSRYLALEVLSEVFTPAADMFSLGATLLDCVTSIEMPKSGTWWQLLRDGLSHNLPEQFSKQMSGELLQVLNVMMNKEYRQRPSAEQLLNHPLLHSRDRQRQQSLKLIHFDFEVSPMKRLKLDQMGSEQTVERIGPEQELDFNRDRIDITGNRISCLRHVDKHHSANLSGHFLEHTTTNKKKHSEHQSPSPPEREEKEEYDSSLAATLTAQTSLPAANMSSQLVHPVSMSERDIIWDSTSDVTTPHTSPRDHSLSTSISPDGFFTPSNFDLTFCNDKFYTAIVPSRLRMISDSSHSHGWSEWLSDSEAENVEEELAVYDNLKHSLSFSSDTGDRETERSVSNSSNCVKESLLTNGADNRKYKNDDLETPPFELGRKAFSSSSKKRHAVEMSSESPYPSEARSNFNFCNVEGGKGAKQTGGVTPLSLFGDSNNWSSEYDDLF